MICYKITNKLTGDIYIGITKKRLVARWWQHLSVARCGGKSTMSRAIRKYGEDAFAMEVLQEANDWNEICAIERDMIAKFNPKYNSSLGGEGGGKWDEERKARQADRARKQWADKQAREKLVAARNSEDGKRLIAARTKEQMLKPEVRKRNSEMAKERMNTPEFRKAQSEVAAKVFKEFWSDENNRKTQSEKIKEIRNRPEMKKKVSAISKKIWSDPEQRRRQSEIAKADWAKRKLAKCVQTTSNL